MINWGRRKADNQPYVKKSKKNLTIVVGSIKPTSGKKHFATNLQKPFEGNPEDSIGLRRRAEKPYFSKETMDNPIRLEGNKLIHRIVDMSKQEHPDVKNWQLYSSSVFNEYSNIQKSLYYARDNVEQLIKWKNDKNPKTWKWVSPIILDDGKINSRNFKVFDSHNGGWISDGYKGTMALTIMSPEEFLNLVNPNTLRYGRNDIRGEEFTQKNLDRLAKRMMEGKEIDTVYINVDKNLQAYNHEGQHRALSAIKAGIKKIPVYIYKSEPFTDDELKILSSNPLQILKPVEER